MEKTSYVYILLFPKSRTIKVGKADNIINRVLILERIWGPIDYENSYKMAVPMQQVYAVEKMLHFLLAQYRYQASENKDGYTELFSHDALAAALRHIDYFVTEKIFPDSLTRDIERREMSPGVKKKRSRYASQTRTVGNLFSNVQQINQQFAVINRLLLILLKKQSRIKYQYNCTESEVCFRIISPGLNPSIDCLRIMRLLSFNFNDFHHGGGINCCVESRTEGDLHQFIIRTLVDEKQHFPFLGYMFSQSLQLLKALPPRSVALQDDLPVLGK